MSSLTICAIIFVLSLLAFAFCSKYVSLTVMSLISMMLMVLFGCLDAKTALGCFSNGSAILMASIFVVAAGLNRTQMVKHLSSWICKISKGSFTKVLAGYVLLTFILAQFIPSAVVAFSIVVPLVISVCKEMNVSPSKMMFSLGMTAIAGVITLPFSAAISEMARIQGFLEAYEYTGYNMGLMDITYAKLPVVIVMMLIAIFVLPRFAPDKMPALEENSQSGAAKKEEPVLDPVREVIGYGTFILVLLGLIFSSKLGLANWQVTMIGALIIVSTGVLNKKQAIESMNLSMVLLYIGALGIGNALSQTGAADMIGNALAGVVNGINNNYLIGLILFIVPFILTQVMLNLGVYSIFTPLYIMLCKSMGANPIGPIMLCMIACMTAFFTPMATPAVPVMMSAGDYSVKDLMKMGVIPFIVITIVSVGWIMTVYPLV